MNFELFSFLYFPFMMSSFGLLLIVIRGGEICDCDDSRTKNHITANQLSFSMFMTLVFPYALIFCSVSSNMNICVPGQNPGKLFYIGLLLLFIIAWFIAYLIEACSLVNAFLQFFQKKWILFFLFVLGIILSVGFVIKQGRLAAGY